MRRKTWRTWTRKELDRLEGKTFDQIAAALGRTRSPIANRIHLDGIGRINPKEERWLRVLETSRTEREAAERQN